VHLADYVLLTSSLEDVFFPVQWVFPLFRPFPDLALRQDRVAPSGLVGVTPFLRCRVRKIFFLPCVVGSPFTLSRLEGAAALRTAMFALLVASGTC